MEPEVKVEIKSNLSGKVVDLPVRAGDVVTKGQLIARIEPDVNQAQDLLAVRNRGEAANIDLEDAKQDYEAKRKLFENGLISVEVNREAETRYRQAQQALDALGWRPRNWSAYSRPSSAATGASPCAWT